MHEICLIHNGNKNDSSEGGVIISCLFEEGPHYGEAEEFINQFINLIPAVNTDFVEEVFK